MEGNEIPALFWMGLISVISIFVCLILYYIAMLVRESTGAVEDARVTIRTANLMLKDIEEIVAKLKGVASMIESGVAMIKEDVIRPIKSIGRYTSAVSGFFEGVAGERSGK